MRVSALGDVLRLCPTSDEEQRRRLGDAYRLHSPADLEGAVVFGTGLLGVGLATALREQGLEPAAFSDNDPTRWGETVAGLPVIRPADIDARRPLVIASKFVKDIVAGLPRADDGRPPVPHYLLPVLLPGRFAGGYHALSADTITAGRTGIEQAFARLTDEPSRALFLQLLRFRLTLDPLDLPDPAPDQYFPAGFWRLDEHEVFVDVGACEGDTLVDFLRRTHGRFDRYFAVEPDSRNLLALQRLVEGLADPRVVVAPCAAGERSEILSFVEGRGGESRVGPEGAVKVEAIPLDKLLAGERVTTIKIDVEGYERQTLQGARQIISDLGPKLAVSVYHLLPDLWEIPQAVAACRSDYRCYLRHHTAEIYDTVLYCVGEDDRQAPRAGSGRP